MEMAYQPAVTKTIKPEAFVLTLTRDEALLVLALVGEVTGSGAPREAAQEIWNGLNESLESNRFENRDGSQWDFSDGRYGVVTDDYSLSLSKVR